MAKPLRVLSRRSRNIKMAGPFDEEEPFLTPKSPEFWKSIKASRGIRASCSRNLSLQRRTGRIVLMSLVILAIIFMSLWISTGGSSNPTLQLPSPCDTIAAGYQCLPSLSHHWGQYSPYFLVPSLITPTLPTQCTLTFAQVLSRHGARDPTSSKSIAYSHMIAKIKDYVTRYEGDYEFLEDYVYSLGADQLTAFGEQEMVNSGIDFYERYQALANASVPFIRASGQQRVIESAEKFGQGFIHAKVAAGGTRDAYNVVTISEARGSNNTLDHGLCTNFESSNTSFVAQNTYTSTFIPSITTRLNDNLLCANLTDADTISFMDLCPYETVADPLGTISPFCALFTQSEWENYDYYQTLGKYYGFGPGNPLGPTQGVGFVNELIARLTSAPVRDHTSVNQTLDANSTTFPLGRSIYADFGHDNDMTAVFAAMGLYNNTPPLSTTELMTVEEMKGYSAAWTVPFAARAVFEKLQCEDAAEEMVRVLVNGRVLPLDQCGGDTLGRCTLSAFVSSLSFAQDGGHWDRCFTSTSNDGTPET